MNELSQERDSIKDIPWLIYYNKTVDISDIDVKKTKFSKNKDKLDTLFG